MTGAGKTVLRPLTSVACLSYISKIKPTTPTAIFLPSTSPPACIVGLSVVRRALSDHDTAEVMRKAKG